MDFVNVLDLETQNLSLSEGETVKTIKRRKIMYKYPDGIIKELQIRCKTPASCSGLQSEPVYGKPDAVGKYHQTTFFLDPEKKEHAALHDIIVEIYNIVQAAYGDQTRVYVPMNNSQEKGNEIPIYFKFMETGFGAMLTQIYDLQGNKKALTRSNSSMVFTVGFPEVKTTKINLKFTLTQICVMETKSEAPLLLLGNE